LSVAAVPTGAFWKDRRVLVTGHTGFVGGWLCSWLAQLGARVAGFSLPPPTVPSFFESTRLVDRLARHTLGDVNDRDAVAAALTASDPQVVFHLAAQPLVREAYRSPVATFATNVMGTVHVLDACRQHAAIERIVVYTTDKVYRNDQSGRAFSESDRLGGNEPYSASKAGADWAVGAWWESYFRHATPRPALATVRAGNIIGGGDWGVDRLLPDAMRAFSQGLPLVIRNPAATRPWQHVLDAVRGTIVLAERAAVSDVPADAIAWNLGPAPAFVRPVSDVATAAASAWGGDARWRHEPDGAIPESSALVLSSERAQRELGWRCAWDFETAVARSVEWYRALPLGVDRLRSLTEAQIAQHAREASA
jgi:CDP-glucose 4,6-dehydratase